MPWISGAGRRKSNRWRRGAAFPGGAHPTESESPPSRYSRQGEAQQLKLFRSDVAPPADEQQVARVLLQKVRLERTRQFGACYVGLELWKRLGLDRFFEQMVR